MIPQFFHDWQAVLVQWCSLLILPWPWRSSGRLFGKSSLPWEAIAGRLEAIASRLEAIAIRQKLFP